MSVNEKLFIIVVLSAIACYLRSEEWF